MQQVQIAGKVAKGFEKVKEAFAANWQGIEVGASYSVVYQGEQVVDLWGGHQNREGSKDWQRDTLVNVYSTTKGMASLAMAILAEEGKLDYEALVVDYWPEFGAEGKHQVTVAQLLSHQAGVCGVSEKITVEDLYDWDKMVHLLAAQKPHWEPGTAAGYHAITWGYLAGELIRRITGQTLGQYFHNKVAAPLEADFYIGLPDSEMDRVADMIGPNHARIRPPRGDGPPPKMPQLYPVTLLNPSIRPYGDASSYAWRKAEIAAANGQANARGIARIYGALANGGEIDGVKIISREAIEIAVQQEVGDQKDLVIGMPMRRARGFILNSAGGYGPSNRAFGHSGAGGSTGFADPDANIGIGYAMNQMESNPAAVPRSNLLLDATYACL
jgi:CubicO group peptidase (beta-lactamase class C family)|tara:strand:- start:13387 stop:14541 length:1155 start_codon:yes stop_codon:yes gene_type:complete